MTIPIPQRPTGFLIGDAAAKITIDAFMMMLRMACLILRLLIPF